MTCLRPCPQNPMTPALWMVRVPLICILSTFIPANAICGWHEPIGNTDIRRSYHKYILIMTLVLVFVMLISWPRSHDNVLRKLKLLINRKRILLCSNILSIMGPFSFYVTYATSALAITPFHQQNKHDLADGRKNMNDIFNNYVCSASHMRSGLHFQNV